MLNYQEVMAGAAGVEPATCGFGDRCVANKINGLLLSCRCVHPLKTHGHMDESNTSRRAV